MLITLLVLVVVFCIVAWIVSAVPLPATPFPFRTILYILLAIVAIIMILRVTGVSL